MLQQSTLSISAHQSNQDASFAESDSKDLLQQHDATSSCCPSSSSSCSTTDTFSTGRRSRIGGNDNSVVRAISPEGRRYLKPVNGIQAKGFARSGKLCCVCYLLLWRMLRMKQSNLICISKSTTTIIRSYAWLD